MAPLRCGCNCTVGGSCAHCSTAHWVRLHHGWHLRSLRHRLPMAANHPFIEEMATTQVLAVELS